MGAGIVGPGRIVSLGQVFLPNLFGLCARANFLVDDREVVERNAVAGPLGECAFEQFDSGPVVGAAKRRGFGELKIRGC
jgi:hypothetical protein